MVVGAGFRAWPRRSTSTTTGSRWSCSRRAIGSGAGSCRLENGELAELGAEWIMPEDEVLQATIDRLGLSASEAGVDYLRREPRGRAAVPMAELDAFLEAADAHLASSNATGSSMGSMLDAVPGDDRARVVAKARQGRSRAISTTSPGGRDGTRDAWPPSPPSTGAWLVGTSRSPTPPPVCCRTSDSGAERRASSSDAAASRSGPAMIGSTRTPSWSPCPSAS